MKEDESPFQIDKLKILLELMVINPTCHINKTKKTKTGFTPHAYIHIITMATMLPAKNNNHPLC